MDMKKTIKNHYWYKFYGVCIGLLFLALSAFLSSRQEFKLSFLDVGQGDSILIQTAQHKNILIDTGPDGSVVDRLGEELGFFDKTIDLFILTHPDRDHYAGILDVMKQYEIRKVLLTGVSTSDPVYLAFLEEIKKKNIELMFNQQHLDLQIGPDLFLDILYPFENKSLVGRSVKDKNNTSVTVRLVRWTGEDYEPLAMLSGDAEAEQELELVLSGQDLSAPILKLGHHGSKTSTSDVFLAAVGPDIAIISAGLDNQFGHPHPEVMEKVKDLEIRQTMVEGTVAFKW